MSIVFKNTQKYKNSFENVKARESANTSQIV